MPFKMTNFLEKKILKLALENGSGAFPAPAHAYLGLFTAFDEPSDGDSFTEISTSGTGYVRQQAAFDAPVAGVTQNTSIIDFPLASTDWGTITYWGLFDALTSGNMMYWGLVGTPDSILTGQQFEVAAGAVSVAITGSLTPYLANKIVSHTLRGTTYTSPATIYTAIFTAYTNDSSYTELTDSNYARQTSSFSVPTDLVTDCSNSGDITYAVMTADFTANFVAIFDAVSGGNMLLRGPLTPPRTVTAGKIFKYPTNALTITAD